MYIKDVILVILLFTVVFGVFNLYLKKKGIDYVNLYGVTAVYFLVFTIVGFCMFYRYIITLVANFSIFSLWPLAVFFILNILVYYLANRFIQKPMDVIMKYKEDFLKIDYRYMFSKSFEILFQQLIVAIVAAVLRNMGFDTYKIVLAFAILFALPHVFLIFITDLKFAMFYTFSAMLSAVAFPLLILKINNGFIFSYIVHFVFYTCSALVVWILRGQRNAKGNVGEY
ncbi:MAG: hypothetical protein N3B21_07800 [Clostridia bacterium]|nr:hypothetical protein [Clostridia bacterium]